MRKISKVNKTMKVTEENVGFNLTSLRVKGSEIFIPNFKQALA